LDRQPHRVSPQKTRLAVEMLQLPNLADLWMARVI
jgi:hypothetical protein